MLAGRLQKAEPPAISGPNTLVLRFAPGYNTQRDYCQEPASVARVEEALKKVTGQACQFRVESVGGAAAPAAGDAAEATGTPPSRYRRQRAEAAQEPLLKRAIDSLGAQIVQVDEGFGGAPATAGKAAADEEE